MNFRNPQPTQSVSWRFSNHMPQPFPLFPLVPFYPRDRTAFPLSSPLVTPFDEPKELPSPVWPWSSFTSRDGYGTEPCIDEPWKNLTETFIECSDDSDVDEDELKEEDIVLDDDEPELVEDGDDEIELDDEPENEADVEGKSSEKSNEDTEQVDYRKLDVSYLRTMVLTRGLATDTKKLKKSDLIRLLEN